MLRPDDQFLLNIADEFHTRFYFLMCLGPVDVKDVRVKKKQKTSDSGSKYFNYKHFFYLYPSLSQGNTDLWTIWSMPVMEKTCAKQILSSKTKYSARN